MSFTRQLAARSVHQLRGLAPKVRELQQFAQLPEQESRQQINQKLWEQFQYFGHRDDALPEWKEAAQIKNPEELRSVWSELPIMTKQDLQNQFHPDELQSRLGIQGIIASTGGSTGEPVHFIHDQNMMLHKAAARIYCREAFGWKPGMATVCLWGSERDIGSTQNWKGRTKSFLQNYHMIDGYHLNDRTVDRLRKLIQSHKSIALYGFTTMLEYVARTFLENGENYSGKIATAWNGGEMLYPEQSQLFERVFGVPILNFYGGRELSSMAFQTSADSPLKVIRPHLFLEIVNEQGLPAGPGESGRLIWTSTVNRATPFLRFEIGDLGMYTEQDKDESGIHALRELHGRSAGIIHLQNGKTINNLYWYHLFKDYPQVQQFQVAIIEGQQLELRLLGTRFEGDEEQRLYQILQNFLGDFPVTINWVESLKRTQQGKLVQVVRESRNTEILDAA